MADKNWDLAVQLRGRSFARNLETYKMLTRLKPPKEAFNESGKPSVSFSFYNVIASLSLGFINMFIDLYIPQIYSNTFKATYTKLGILSDSLNNWLFIIDLFQWSIHRRFSLSFLFISFTLFDAQEGLTLAVMHVGAPACGMNAAVRSFVRNCIYRGDTVLGIHDGMEGFIGGNIVKMEW